MTAELGFGAKPVLQGLNVAVPAIHGDMQIGHGHPLSRLPNVYHISKQLQAVRVGPPGGVTTSVGTETEEMT
jgi:hypothetical protein